MKTVLALLVPTVLGLSASGQSLPPRPDNWGPTQQGVRVSLSLDKSTYAVGEPIYLFIKAQIVSAERPLYAVPDTPTFIKNVPVARAFHLTILDEKGQIVGNDEPSNLEYIAGGSSGPVQCPTPLEVAGCMSSDFPPTEGITLYRRCPEPIASSLRGAPIRRPIRLVTIPEPLLIHRNCDLL